MTRPRNEDGVTPSGAANRSASGRAALRALTLLAALAAPLSACRTLAPAGPGLGPAAACGTTNLAQGRSASASSTENSGFLGAASAVDGDAATRWASLPSDPQWLQVDLGRVQGLCRVVLEWETAYGRAFRIEVSNDGSSWTPVAEVADGTGGVQTLAVGGSGQYVRVYGLRRGTGYGYSLFEFRVYGGAGGTPGGGGPTGPGITRVVGSHGNWQLSVDGAPYVVKGLTWGPPVAEATARMPELKAMGVNTVRTWGTDGSSQTLFDAAAANGVKVMAGFWLQPGGGPGSGGCVNYVTDSNYKSGMLAEIRRWVTQYKTHKGVLMWNIGNESILGMQGCFSGAELENQRVAYARFVNEAARAVHEIDPNHPVTNTDAWTGAWAYLKAHAPDLDLYAVNSYGSVCDVKQNWLSGGYTKPYLITEGGPAGEWEVPNDANGVPTEPTDVQKRDGYARAWGCVTGHPGVALGATLFHYGTEGDFGGVWFNLIPNGEKRLSYYAVRRLYGGETATNTPPVISSLTLSRTTDVPAGGTFTVSASVNDPDGDPVSYTMGYNSRYINGAGGIVPATFTGPGPWTVTAPQQLGVWKLYLYARDGRGNVGIETRSLRVVAPPIAGTNLALGKATAASSYQTVGDGAPYPPQNATDGDAATRWASDWSDPQWLELDLGAATTFDQVQLVWEAAYGKSYRLQVSDDGRAWRDLYATTTGDGGADTFRVGPVSARHVRLYGLQRGTGYGYALYEFGLYRAP